ncbi:MAG: insulinase family protein [Chitinophagales bacterium]|nr:insulinase family protein [Chitinophagales bacterium]
MKRYIFALSVLFVLTQCAKKPATMMVDNSKAWRATAPAAAPARDIELGTYSSFDLNNGLKVIVVENHKLPRVSYQLAFNHDALLEADKAGYTAIAGDLLSKGTKTKTKAEIDEAIDFIGGSINTTAQGIYASSLKKHSEKLLDIMTDMLYNPVFSQDEFNKIKKKTESALASSKTSPEAIAANIRSKVNFGERHPYGEVQTEETLKNIELKDCVDYYNTYFKPNNAYLVIVGDITAQEAKDQVNKYFSKWTKGALPSFGAPKVMEPRGAQVHFGNKDGAVQSVINISYAVDLTPGSADAIKANLMNSVLGGGIFSGRLMQNLREKHAYTYGARSTLATDKIKGYFNAYASVRNEVTDSSITQFLIEMNRIVNEPISSEDLKIVKSSTAGNFGRSLESPQTIANFALNTYRYNLPKDYYNHYLKNVDAVTVADIQAMAKKYIRPENCNIIVVGSKDQVADKLLQFDADGKIDYYDPFGNKIKEVKVEIKDGVTPSSIVANYLSAIGGTKKLGEVQTISQKAKSNIMGQDATIETHMSKAGKSAMTMSMMGMNIQEQRFDGTKAMIAQMGQKQIMDSGDELEEMKDAAKLFAQMDYSKPGYTMELKGVEAVNGANCYKISVKDPKGKESTEFYDMNSGLLLRSVVAQGPAIITTDYKDYKEVGGIKFPFVQELSGAMPVPLIMEVTSIELNKTSDDVFKVE